MLAGFGFSLCVCFYVLPGWAIMAIISRAAAIIAVSIRLVLFPRETLYANTRYVALHRLKPY
jgi:hypothetical protein